MATTILPHTTLYRLVGSRFRPAVLPAGWEWASEPDARYGGRWICQVAPAGPDLPPFAAALRSWARAAGFSHAALARACGVSRSLLGMVASGQRPPNDRIHNGLAALGFRAEARTARRYERTRARRGSLEDVPLGAWA